MRLFEIEIIFCVGITILIIILLLLKTKRSVYSNFILGAYLCLFSYHFFYRFFDWTRLLYSGNYIEIRLGGKVSLVFVSVLFYLFIKHFITKEIKIKDLVHLLVYPLFALVYVFRPIQNDLIQQGYLHAMILQMLIYGLLSIQLYRKNVNQIETVKKLWIRLFFTLFFALWLIFSLFFYMSYLPEVVFKSQYFFIIIALFFLSLIFGFSRILSKGIDSLSKENRKQDAKYKTGLSKNYSIELRDDLKNVMIEKEPFLNNDLRLEDLADLLNLSRHEMSQVINEHFKVSFFDFINTYRVEKAKRLLLNNSEDLNISQIAYAVGFNNRASFYKAFKKQTKTTPSDYSAKNCK